ncbi:MAG: RluA family pseudouridine synthase [Cyclobacteriaceae bacterium]|nr:RluA family pseudouridine synthase [Cyclobacteriaceae bacterium]
MGKELKLKNWILFEDDDFIVINKPPFLASLDDRSSRFNVNRLAKDYWQDAQMCHRLDKDTSGVLLIAKHPEAYKHASIQFEKRKVDKVYHAVVEGVHEFKNRVINAALITSGKGKVVINQRQGKESETSFMSLGIYNRYSLVECCPVTGRMHQIRVHLAELNAPIVGDEFYGGNPFYLSSIKKKYNLKKGSIENPLIQRFALHAYKLGLTGIDGKAYKFEAPYPKDFRVLVEQLEKNK